MAVCRSEVTSQSRDVNQHCDGFNNLWTRSVFTCKQMSDYLIDMQTSMADDVLMPDSVAPCCTGQLGALTVSSPN